MNGTISIPSLHSTSDDQDDERLLPFGFSVPMVTFLTVVSLTAIIGNGLVLLSWLLHPPVRKPQNIYLVSLASTDITVGLFCAPTMIGELISHHWPYGRTWCQVYMLLAWLLCAVSILHLIAISMDRYHSVFDTFTYMQRRTNSFIIRRVGLCWAFGVWLVIPPILEWETIGNISELKGVCISPLSKGLSLHMAFGCYLLPILLLTSTYVAIYKKLQERRKSMSSLSVSSISHSLVNSVSVTDSVSPICMGRVSMSAEMLGRNQQAAKMLGIIIAAFGISWLPFTIGYSVVGFLPDENKPNPVTLPIIVAIGYSNSAMNPIIYGFCNPDFRQGFKKILLKLMVWRRLFKNEKNNNRV